jgi:hypothetical protein
LPRRSARDQNGGKLTQPYCDATRKYLGDNGVDPDDVAKVMAVLNPYIAEPAEDENLAMRDDPKVVVGGPRGAVGAQDRHLALDQLDQYGRPRSLLATPVSLSGSRGFAERFPEADRRGACV